MAKYLLPFAILTMIFSYQNCADSFDPSLVGAQSIPSNNGNDDGSGDPGNNPPGEPTFDLSSLRMNASEASVLQLDSSILKISVANGAAVPLDLDLKSYITCPQESKKELVGSRCDSEVCFEFSCSESGIAKVSAEAYHANSQVYYSIFTQTPNVEVRSVTKTSVNVSINQPSQFLLNETQRLTANIPVSLSNDDNYALIWAASSPSCSLTPVSGSASVDVLCTNSGDFSISLNASSLRYQGLTSLSFVVGSPSVAISLDGGVDRINVTLESMGFYNFAVMGLESLNVDALEWSHDAGPHCGFSAAKTFGILNEFRCLSRPPSGQVILTASIDDDFYGGSASLVLPVDKGPMQVTFDGLASKQILQEQNLVASIEVDGNTQDAAGYTFKWTLCAEEDGSGGTVVEKVGDHRLSSGAACDSSGIKTFSLQVSNDNFAGSVSNQVPITADYVYEWDVLITFDDGMYGAPHCASFNPGTCKAGKEGLRKHCCSHYETFRKSGEKAFGQDDFFCSVGKEFTCKKSLR